MPRKADEHVFAALDRFKIELPSWGFADTGTRFGKFLQHAAASTLEEKLADAGVCHALTGSCPTVAVHVLWDFAPAQNPREVARLAEKFGVKIGSINPNLFQHQFYKFGSLANPDPVIRKTATQHVLECIAIAKAVGSKLISLWLADGTNYPGQGNIRQRKLDLQAALKEIHNALPPKSTLLVEYKPFEPAFYHTDIADWGMSAFFCRHAGPSAKVLVDTGHHLPGCNIEHLVAFLLDEGLLGGFHFNDRKYADDDLELGSMDPYGVFRIFNAIVQHEFDTGKRADIAYMVDQSHNLKPKIQAMLQTVDRAQSLFARAQLVDRKALAAAQKKCDIIAAERVLVDAYETDVRPMLAAWRKANKLPADPLNAYRASGHEQTIGEQRRRVRKDRGENAGGSYA